MIRCVLSPHNTEIKPFHGKEVLLVSVAKLEASMGDVVRELKTPWSLPSQGSCAYAGSLACSERLDAARSPPDLPIDRFRGHSTADALPGLDLEQLLFSGH